MQGRTKMKPCRCSLCVPWATWLSVLLGRYQTGTGSGAREGLEGFVGTLLQEVWGVAE